MEAPLPEGSELFELRVQDRATSDGRRFALEVTGEVVAIGGDGAGGRVVESRGATTLKGIAVAAGASWSGTFRR